MESTESVTQWLEGLKDGDEQALGALLDRYWPYLIRLARRNLSGAKKRMHDEEDVAQKAFWSFYQSFKAGRFPKVESREHLLALLVTISSHQASKQMEHDRAQKRGSGKVRGESVFRALAETATHGGGIDQLAGSHLTPEEEVILAENYHRYLDRLADEHRPIAEKYLAGLTNKQIAETSGTSLRSVERKLAMIKKRWKRWALEELLQG
ncbi:MAG: ECF-type sigma factor [Planctomycetota bacterium]|nr:ECF-type sigma factor [Planctomycetota bacterium]